MALVDCRSCGGRTDDMDGACAVCGKSVYADVADVFTGDPVPPKKIASSNRPPGKACRSAPLPPVEDREWADDPLHAVSEAQDVFEQCRSDWEKASLNAMVAEERIIMHRWHYRALAPDERHDYAQQLAAITFAKASWTAYQEAQERYFKLLDRFAELERRDLGLTPGGGLVDPSDPYRGSGDDGSLAWAQRAAEAARKDRLSDGGPARGFTVD